MTNYGVCRVCESVVRTSNFQAHRSFHEQAGTRDPGPHGYYEIAGFPGAGR